MKCRESSRPEAGCPGSDAAVEREREALDDAAPAVRVPDELVAVERFAFPDDGADDGIEPGQSRRR